MSYPEHLIENALSALEGHDDPCKAREDFFGDNRNITMAAAAKLSLEAVWEMANYVILTWYPFKEFMDGK